MEKKQHTPQKYMSLQTKNDQRNDIAIKRMMKWKQEFNNSTMCMKEVCMMPISHYYGQAVGRTRIKRRKENRNLAREPAEFKSKPINLLQL